ncbi:MAG: hypothetical protein Kow0099_09810 [Candidatus Abyssubacteria bacterium]
MAPREGYPNELARFLKANKESVVTRWIAGLRSIPALRKKLPSSSDELHDAAARIYDALVLPLSVPTKAKRTRKVRLSKAQRECLEPLSPHDIQHAQILLFNTLAATVRKKYARNAKKSERYSGALCDRMHDLMLQVLQDDLRKREESVSRSHNKYARLLDIASDAIFLMRFDSGVFVEVNKAACELTGYSEAELKSMGFNSLVSVFDLNLALERANAAIEQGAVRFDDLSILTKSGEALPVDISASAVTVDGARHILAIMRDIKERKHFEESIKEKARRLQLVTEIAQVITLAGLDIETVLTNILKGVSRVMKVKAGSILKLQDGELVFMVALGEKADYVKPFRLKLGQGIAGWVAEQGTGVIVRDVHKDPRYYSEIERATGFKTKSILAVPMKTRDAVVGVIELINKVGGQFTKNDLDLMNVISSFAAAALEHAELYSECQLARARLMEVHSPVSSSRLAGVVAHEMKDPLGIIKNYVKILSDRLSSEGLAQEELGVISEEIDRTTKIIDQLLSFSEACSEVPKETPLNLLVKNSVESMGEALEQARIETELKLDASVPPAWVVPNQMKMVLANLLRLTISEMPDGGTLTVATRRRDPFVHIELSNTGRKHTRAEADELFLPSAVAKGLVPKGLGLYMVYNIVQGHGGDIEVKPRKDKGSTYRVKIPLNSGVSR